MPCAERPAECLRNIEEDILQNVWLRGGGVRNAGVRVIGSEVGRPMTWWNFLEPDQVKPRSELRRRSQEDEEEEGKEDKK